MTRRARPSRLWAASLIAAVLLGAGTVEAQPAPFLPEGPYPRILSLPGLRPSPCKLPEPTSPPIRTYGLPGIGTYAAHGDPALLPKRLDALPGRAEYPMSEILYGAQTTFEFPATARIDRHPNPISSLGVPRQPMAELWGAQVRTDPTAHTVLYRLHMTAAAWEVPGPHTAACLYFHPKRA